MTKKYTKADLEEMVYLQQENLNAVHDLIGILKYQNNLLEEVNSQLKVEILRFKKALKGKGFKKRKRK